MSHKVRELAPNDLLLSHALNLPSICHTGFYRLACNVGIDQRCVLDRYIDIGSVIHKSSTTYLSIFSKSYDRTLA